MNIALFICQHPSHVFGGELLEQMASLTQICYRNVNIVQSEVKDYIICTYDKRDMGNVNSNQMDPHCQLNLQTVLCEIQVHSLGVEENICVRWREPSCAGGVLRFCCKFGSSGSLCQYYHMWISIPAQCLGLKVPWILMFNLLLQT